MWVSRVQVESKTEPTQPMDTPKFWNVMYNKIVNPQLTASYVLSIKINFFYNIESFSFWEFVSKLNK